MRVYIDRVANDPNGEFVNVDDCEKGDAPAPARARGRELRLRAAREFVAGLDRPLKKPADYARFAGSAIELTLKLAFQGRKKWQRRAAAAAGEIGDGWRLVFNDGKTDQALDFSLDEVREARLVPVVDFRGGVPPPRSPPPPAAAPGQEVDGGRER